MSGSVTRSAFEQMLTSGIVTGQGGCPIALCMVPHAT